MWYVFGFTERQPVGLPEGAIGAPTALPLDGVDGYVITAPLDTGATSWDDVDPEQLAASAVHHDQVLTAAIGCNVLPARFGSSVPSREAAIGSGQIQRDVLAAAFERSRGRAEFDVRVRSVRTSVRGSGREYLLRRRDQLAGDDELGVVTDLIAAAATSSEVRERSSDAARVAVLASPDEIRQIRDALADRADMATEILGPYAPYSFARTPEILDHART